MNKIADDLTGSSQFRAELRLALEKLIKHKVEDFEFDMMEAKDPQSDVTHESSTRPKPDEELS